MPMVHWVSAPGPVTSVMTTPQEPPPSAGHPFTRASLWPTLGSMPCANTGSKVGLALFMILVAASCSSNGMSTGSSRGSCVSGPCIAEEMGSGGSLSLGDPSGAGDVPGAGGTTGAVPSAPNAGAWGAAGFPNSGGGSPAPGSSTCVPSSPSSDDPRNKKSCVDDGDCPSNKFCDQSHGISGWCDCVDGQKRCSEYFNYFCDDYATSCRPASASFTSRLKGESCTVVIRTDANGNQIKGHDLLCGPLKPTTPAQAFEQLRPMSSVYWGEATLVDDGAKTGIIAYTTSDTLYSYTAFISANTGQMLLLGYQALDARATSRLSGNPWGAADDLGTSCASGEQVSTFGSISSIMIGNPSTFSWEAQRLISGTDIYRSLRQAVKPSLKQGVAAVATPTPELVFFVTSP